MRENCKRKCSFPGVNCQQSVHLVYTQKTSGKQYIYPLEKTTVKAYENEASNGSFLMRENCKWKCSCPGVNRQHVHAENVGQTTHLLARENYGEGIWKQGAKWKFPQFGKIASECVVYLVLTVSI